MFVVPEVHRRGKRRHRHRRQIHGRVQRFDLRVVPHLERAEIHLRDDRAHGQLQLIGIERPARFTATTTAPITAGNCSKIVAGRRSGATGACGRAEIDRAVDDLRDAGARAGCLDSSASSRPLAVEFNPTRVDRCAGRSRLRQRFHRRSRRRSRRRQGDCGAESARGARPALSHFRQHGYLLVVRSKRPSRTRVKLGAKARPAAPGPNARSVLPVDLRPHLDDIGMARIGVLRAIGAAREVDIVPRVVELHLDVI